MKCNYYNLKELATIKYGKNQKNVISETGDFPIFGTGGLMGYATKYLYDKPTVMIGRKGTINKVRYYDKPFWTVDTLFYTEINENIIFPKFFYYLLSRVDFNQYNEGTTIPSLRTETLYRLEFEVPSLKVQDKIIKLLGPIDNKIKLNEAINNNLEQQAMTIYKQCFDSDVNQEWKKGVLSDVADITMGQSPIGTSLNTEGNGTLFFQGRTDFSFRFPNIRLFTTEPKRMASINDILMSVRAPVGDLNVAHIECCIGRGLAAIRSKLNHQSFIFYTLRFLKRKLDSFNGEGTVFGSINKQALNNFPILIPPAEKIDEFETLVSFMDLTIRNNYNEIHRLNQMRDILLPKLLSGELDVSNIDI